MHEYQVSQRRRAEKAGSPAPDVYFTDSLRSAHALQLAAAVVLGATEVAELEFVTLDDTLAQAVRREGFRVFCSTTA